MNQGDEDPTGHNGNEDFDYTRMIEALAEVQRYHEVTQAQRRGNNNQPGPNQDNNDQPERGEPDIFDQYILPPTMTICSWVLWTLERIPFRYLMRVFVGIITVPMIILGVIFMITYPVLRWYCRSSWIQWLYGRASFCDWIYPPLSQANAQTVLNWTMLDQAIKLERSGWDAIYFAKLIDNPDRTFNYTELADQQHRCGAQGTAAGTATQFFVRTLVPDLETRVRGLAELEAAAEHELERGNFLRYSHFAYYWQWPEAAILDTFVPLKLDAEQIIGNFTENAIELINEVIGVAICVHDKTKTRSTAAKHINNEIIPQLWVWCRTAGFFCSPGALEAFKDQGILKKMVDVDEPLEKSAHNIMQDLVWVQKRAQYPLQATKTVEFGNERKQLQDVVDTCRAYKNKIGDITARIEHGEPKRLSS